MKIANHLVLFSLLVAPLEAQQESAVRQGRVMPNREAPVAIPRMVIQKGEKDQPVIVQEAEVVSRIMGGLCETTVTMVFENPNNRVLEGELYFPLPEGAVIQGYALDINGNMVDGVPVPKEKARMVFEEEQRRGVDPGLVEWSGGNQFKTRVHPIPGKGTRKVRLRYTTILSPNKDGATLYQLPLNFGNRMKSFKLRVEVATDEKPQIDKSPVDNLSFEEVRGVFIAEKELKDIALTEDLKLTLPKGGVGDEKAFVEKADGKCYVAVAVKPPPMAAVKNAVPESLAIVWDASGSMEKADTARAIDFISAYLNKNMGKTLKEVKLVLVREKVGKAQVFGRASDLIKALKEVKYDGATADIQQAIPTRKDAGLCFVVSDGIANFTRGKLIEDLAPTVALVVSSGTDFHALERMNARVLNLTERSTEQALADLDDQGMSVAMLLLDGQPWKDAVCNSRRLQTGEFLLVTGTVPGGDHKISVVLQPYSEGEREKVLEFSCSTKDVPEGSLVRSFYAQNLLNSSLLEPESAERSAFIKSLGDEYGIVTPGTSLLVLESLDQYVRHGVRPPASAPKERALYDERMLREKKEREQERERNLSSQKKRSLDGWKEKIKWLATDFSLKKNQEKIATKEEVSQSDQFSGSFGAGRSSRDEQRAPAAPVRVETRFVGEALAPDASSALLAENGLATGGIRRDSLEKSKMSGNARTGASIQVRPWSSKAPYMEALKASAKPYETYLKLKKEYGGAPGFYLDCADFFAQSGNNETALLVLSNLVEMDLENRSLLRILGYKLRYLGDLEKATFVFDRVKDLFPEEPQSYRDLALALAEMGDNQAAVDMFRKILENPMQNRFEGVEQVALVEMNRLIAKAEREGKPVNVDGLDSSFIKPADADVRVVINWDTDASDMDLWVTDSNKEKCDYSHKRTKTGGMISRDVTQGYGPEEYLISKALKGDYKVQTHYYGSGSQRMLAPVTLYAEVYTDYGRPEEKRKTLFFRLEDKDNIVDVGTVVYKPDDSDPSVRDYQVKKGDTLKSIIERELGGDQGRFKELLKLNPSIKWQSRDVLPGEFIKLPK